MLQAKHANEYRKLATLLTRYGLRDFRLDFDPEQLRLEDEQEEIEMEPGVRERARAFARTLKEMGPTYIKFGQVLSTRSDFVPPEYIEELESLQDDLEPFSYAEVEKIVEEELGVRMSKLFTDFTDQPVAAASLGQAHPAVLRDGREVIVKVQRPGVRERVDDDLEVFTEIAEFVEQHSSFGRKMNLVGTVKQARRTLNSELNYLQEAQNMRTLRRNLAEFEGIYVPIVLEDLTTSRVLTMEMVRGRKISKLSPVAITEHDYAELASQLTRAYLKQICVDGVWHADPHPGNVFLREGELVLLDFGMVSRISHEMQDAIIKLLLAITENRGSEAAEVCIRLGTAQRGFDRQKFREEIAGLVSDYHDADLTHTSTGQLMFFVISVANRNELQVPSELAMLAKTLLHLDTITRKLDPEYDPREVIREYSENLLTKKVRQKFHPRNFYTPLIELNELVMELPRRTREIVEKTSQGQLTLQVRLSQVDDLLKAIHKIANRITAGLILAAIIIGSALMMRVPSGVRFFGYPAIAVIGFVGASLIGFYLILSMIIRDRKDRKRAVERMDEV